MPRLLASDGYTSPGQRLNPVHAVLTLAVLATAGCMMPEPVLRLTPLSDNVVWAGGMAAVVKQAKAARVAVAFAREHDGKVGFRVEIENTSPVPILIDPARFYYAACNRSADGASRTCQPSRLAFNPEQVLLDLDIQHSRQEASTANAETFAGAMMFLDLTLGVAGAASGNRHAAMAGLDGADHSAQALDAISAEGQQQASTYEMERASWETAAFRKSTIPPGHRVAGLVYVDRHLAANEVSLQIRIGDEILDFPFKQMQFQARTSHANQNPFPETQWMAP